MLKDIRDQVEVFLKEFTQYASVFGLVVAYREKNLKALQELGISADQREEIILSLKPEDYYRGPSFDPSYQCDMWEFGKKIPIYQGDIYIKLSSRKMKNRKRVCISFHPAEHAITYPLKGRR